MTSSNFFDKGIPIEKSDRASACALVQSGSVYLLTRCELQLVIQLIQLFLEEKYTGTINKYIHYTLPVLTSIFVRGKSYSYAKFVLSNDGASICFPPQLTKQKTFDMRNLRIVHTPNIRYQQKIILFVK